MPNWKKVITSGSKASLNAITMSGNIIPDSDNVHSLGTSDNRFQLNGGTPVTVTGSGANTTIARFSGSTEVENSTITNTDTLTTVRHTNDGNQIFVVSGSNGEILSVSDEVGDELLRVNNTSGLPVFIVSASGTLNADRLTASTEDFVLTYNSASGDIYFQSASVIRNESGILSQSAQIADDISGSLSATAIADLGARIASGAGDFVANEFIVAVGKNAITSSDALAVDSSGNLGIGTASPEVRLHMSGDGAQTAQIRMEQFNDTTDAPDIRTRRARGTAAAPADVQTGDYLFRLNVEGRDGGSNVSYASQQFDVDPNDQDALNYKLETRDTGGNLAQRYKIDGSGNHEFTGSVSFSGSLTADTATVDTFTINSTLTADTVTGSLLRLSEGGSGLRLTNVGGFEPQSGTFNIFGNNDVTFGAGGSGAGERVLTLVESSRHAKFELAVSASVFSGSFVGDGSALTGLPAGYTDSDNTDHLNSLAVVSGSATQVRSFLNVEDGADVTDTTNVKASLPSGVVSGSQSQARSQLGLGTAATSASTDFVAVSGDTMTGNLLFNDSVELRLGAGNDLRLYHNGTDSYINNFTGDLYLTNYADDKDIYFSSDDGSGGVATYFRLDGSQLRTTFSKEALWVDNAKVRLGSGGDLELYHNGTNSIISNTTGDLVFTNYADNKDIIFSSDDGSGGTTEYFKLDGSNSFTNFQLKARWVDNANAEFGNSGDLQLYHNGTNSYIDNNTGHLYIRNNVDGDDGGNIYIQAKSGENGITINDDSYVAIYYDNSVKFQTKNTGVDITGDLDVSGTVTANKIVTNVVSQSILLTTGSNIFGDEQVDTHEFTGSVDITGSLTVDKIITAEWIDVERYIRHAGDTNTYLDFNTDDSFRIVTDGTERIRFNGTTAALANNGYLAWGIGESSRPYIQGNNSTDTIQFGVNGNRSLDISNGAVVVNENGLDRDFRVESNNNANILFVNGETDKVGIGLNAPYGKLHLYQPSGDQGFRLTRSTDITGVGIAMAVDSTKNLIDGYGDLLFRTNATGTGTNAVERIRISGSGEVTLGTGNYNQVLLDPDPSSHDGNGSLLIQPTTSPGSGTANYYTNFADRVGGGTTKHHVQIGGNLFLGEYLYHDGDTNTYLRFQDDVVDLYAGGTRFLTAFESTQDVLIVNEGGTDVDFRVESNNNANMLFVDGGNDRVGIGTNSPAAGTALEVSGSLLMNVYDTSGGGTKGIFFRDGFVNSNPYNLSILAYDVDGNGVGSADGLDINAYGGIAFNVGSGTRNEVARITSTGVSGSFVGDGSGLTGITTTVTEETTVSDTFTNVSSHTVTHNFGTKDVFVNVYDSNDNMFIPSTIVTTDTNTVDITFDSSLSGRVVVAKGGHIVSSSLVTSASFASNANNLNAGGQLLGDVTTNGHIIPATADTYDLGSSAKPFRDLYLSEASLYIDGTQVISSTADTISFTTDTGQSIKLLETGADDIILQTDTGNIELKGTVEILTGKKITDSAGTIIQFGNSLGVTGSIEVSGTVDGIDLQAFSSSVATGLNDSSLDLSAVSQSILPHTTEAFDLGSASKRWRDLYLTGSTINLGGTKISRNNDGDIQFLDTSDNLKKLRVEELFVGSGGNVRKLRVGTSGKLEFRDESNNKQDTDVTASLAHTASYMSDTFISSSAARSGFGTGGGGGADVTETATFTATFTNAASASFSHNFGTKNVIVQTYFNDDTLFFPETITTTDNNTVDVTFSSATDGRVVIAKGGHMISSSLGGNLPGITGSVFTNVTSSTVTHDFGTKEVVVSVYDNNDNLIMPSNIKTTTTASVDVTFAQSRSGRIVVSKGGHIVTSTTAEKAVTATSADGLTTAGNRQSIQYVTADTTASLFTTHLLRGSVTMSLPQGTEGDWFKVSNRITSSYAQLSPYGSETIMGDTGSLVVDTDNAGFELIYTDSTDGWIIVGQ